MILLNIKVPDSPYHNLEDAAQDETGCPEEDCANYHKKFEDLNRVWNVWIYF